MNKFILPTIILLLFCSIYGTMTVMNIYDSRDNEIVSINGFEIDENNLNAMNDNLLYSKSSIICNIKNSQCLSVNQDTSNNG